jgi:hypothetical protein
MQDDFTKPVYDALTIAMGYFIQKGIPGPRINRALAVEITNMFNEGEHRTLLLANLAIQKVERQIELERELEELVVSSFFRQHA